jgi:3-deoxy-D-manno-octulosonate 8-phosphate phosphatase (KDO 8-P phosphatase)
MTGEAMAVDPVAARRVRLVVLDVDGVLTDGGIYLGATDEGRTLELKRFHVEDGLGVKFLRRAGIDVAIVSGRVSEATRLRAAEIGVDEVHQDPGARKLPIVDRLRAERSLSWGEVALIGDDLADLPALKRVGLPATVANGVREVRGAARWQSRKQGGHGAVREFAEALLRARGEWDDLVEQYCHERDA